jgi:hypothetical protein
MAIMTALSIAFGHSQDVAIRDTFLGIGPILLGRIFDHILQPSPKKASCRSIQYLVGEYP